MRDFVLLGIIFGSLPFCFFKPYIGVLVWSWISYMNPHRFTWTIAHSFPVAKLVGAATLAGYILFAKEKVFPKKRETILLLLLWLMFTITSFFAVVQQSAWTEWIEKSKILLMTFVTISLVSNMKRLKYFLMIIVFSLGFLGVKGGVFSLLTGGAYIVKGPDDSFIADRNDFALALNMILPIILLLYKEEQNRKLKLIFLGTFLLSILSVIFTYSRGGFLGLAFVILLLILKSNKKFLAIPVICLGLIIFAYLVPHKWMDRIESIKNYEQDSSAMGRINAWKFGWNRTLDHPLTGGGFRVFDEYYGRAAHSIYFQMIGEQGLIAFTLFLALLGSSLLSLRSLRKQSKEEPSLKWVYNYSNMLEVSLLAYMACGTFLSRAYFDLAYHLIAVVVILKVLAEKGVESEEVSETQKGISLSDRIVNFIVNWRIKRDRKAFND